MASIAVRCTDGILDRAFTTCIATRVSAGIINGAFASCIAAMRSWDEAGNHGRMSGGDSITGDTTNVCWKQGAIEVKDYGGQLSFEKMAHQ